MQSNTDLKVALWQKIQHVRVGMLTTVNPDHQLVSRPMTNQKIDDDGQLWFIVSDEAAVSRQIENNASVNISFADPGDSLYVSVSGTAEIVRDRDTIESMWSPLAAAWFPGGADDPHVALIRMRPESAEYWDSDKSKMTQLFAMAKAAVTGKPPTDIGEHQTVRL